jgi:hypothetical protein
MISTSKIASFGALFMALALTGLGCDKLIPDTKEKPTPTETVAAAKEIEFIPGDGFTIKQTFMGVGGLISNLAGFKDGSREVTITRFAPAYAANLDWSLAAQREKADSKKAREAYEAALKEGKATGLPPQPEFEDVVTTGTVNGISLSSSHSAYFPNYWMTTTTDLMGERSAIWLSNDAFQELSRTRFTVLNFGVFDESFQKASQGIADVKEAVNALRQKADVDGAQKDLTLLEADDTTTDYKIRVNGEEKTVSVIKARNWFGEIIVLNNPQNPLILKASLNPLTSGTADAASGANAFFDKFFGFEITDITIKR